MDTAALRTAVTLWCANQDTAQETYGHISTWDTSEVTDMSYLLMTYCGDKRVLFNEDLSSWDVSKVTSMEATFAYGRDLNADLSSWNTSRVNNMQYTFLDTHTFNGDLSRWDVGSVTSMDGLFAYTESFNGDLSSWDVSSVKSMFRMFYDASVFNGDLSPWDVGSVTSMLEMFYNLDLGSFSQELCWNTTGVNTVDMFYQTFDGSADPSAAKCTCISGEYDDGSAGCAPCPGGFWSFGKTESCLFSCPAGEFILTLENGAQCTTACPAGKHGDAVTVVCEDCAGGKYSSLPGRVSQCTDVCSAGKVSTPGATQCTSCSVGQYQNAIEQSACISCIAGRFSSITGRTNSCTDECSAGTSAPAGSSNCTACQAGKYQDLLGMESCRDCAAGTYSSTLKRTTPCTDVCLAGSFAAAGSSSCSVCMGSLNGAGRCLTAMDTAALRTAVRLWCFDQDTALETYGHISTWNTSEVTDMSRLFGADATGEWFADCNRAASSSFNEDLSGWSTGKVTSMDDMFREASSFTGNLQSWDVSSVKTMQYMFYGGGIYNEDLSPWDISSVSNMQYMLYTVGGKPYTQELCWNTTGIITDSIFESANSLASINPAAPKCACTVGQYHDSSAGCVPCISGFRSHGKTQGCFPIESTTNDTDCTPGTYLPEGASQCANCPAGTFSTSVGSTACEACAAGTASSNAGEANPDACVACSSGKHSSVDVGAIDCLDCKPGTYQNNAGQLNCIICDAGRFSSTFGVPTLCPVSCDAGSFSFAGSTECTICSPGSFAALPVSSSCDECAVGKASPNVGEANPDACVACSAGLVAATAGSSSCLSCGVGRFAADGTADLGGGLVKQTPLAATSCNPCPVGFFTKTTASLVCQACDAGKTSSSGASSCSECEAGKVSSAGSSSCTTCLAGTVSVAAGSSSCDECPGDTYSVVGSDICDRCLRFYYRSLQGTCELCPEGSLCPTDGASTQELLTIDKDVWRISATAVTLHACPFPEACTGGTLFVDEGDGYCNEGYTGPLCAVCSEDFYFNSETRGCAKCTDDAGRIFDSPTFALFFSFVAVFLVTFVCGICNGFKKADELAIAANKQASKYEELKKDAKRRNSAANVIYKAKSNGDFSLVRELKEEPKVTIEKHSVELITSVAKTVTTVVVKTTVVRERKEIVIVPSSPLRLGFDLIKKKQDKFKAFVAFCQIAVSIPFNCVIEFPSPFEKILRGLEIFNLNVIPALGLQCSLLRFDYLDQLLVMTLSPLFLMAVLLGVYTVNANKRQTIFTLGLLLSFLVLVGVSSQTIHLFKCDLFDEAEDGKQKAWLFKDYSVDCDGKRYQGFVAYSCFMILVYPIGIPLSYATLIWHHKEMLSDPEAMHDEARSGFPTVGHLKFLIKSYKPKYFYFEVIECVRRLLLTAIIGIVAPDSAAAPVLGMLIAFVFFGILIAIMPFKNESDNRFAVTLTFTLSLFFLAALMIKTDATSDDLDDQRLFGLALVLILAAGPFLVVCEDMWRASRRYIENKRKGKNAPGFLCACCRVAGSAQVTPTGDVADKAKTEVTSSVKSPGDTPSTEGALTLRNSSPFVDNLHAHSAMSTMQHPAKIGGESLTPHVEESLTSSSSVGQFALSSPQAVKKERILGVIEVQEQPPLLSAFPSPPPSPAAHASVGPYESMFRNSKLGNGILSRERGAKRPTDLPSLSRSPKNVSSEESQPGVGELVSIVSFEEKNNVVKRGDE